MKEKIIVSACLLGVNCRYDGKNSHKQSIIDYVEGKDVIRVCPEAMAGMKIPHPSGEIKDGKVIDIEGNDVTHYFKSGAEKVLDLAKEKGVQKAILKSKSPSCGCGVIYDGNFNRTLIPGNGFTAQILIDHGIEVISSDNKQF